MWDYYPMKAVRALAASCTLLVASFAAHILAGGDSLSLHSALPMVFLSFLISTLLIRKSGDPIRVAIAIFVAQNAGHLILGGQASSDSQMLFAHVSAGVLSYHLLRYFDRNLPDLGRAFIALLAPALPHIQIKITLPPFVSEFSYPNLNTQHLSTAYSLRGPPLH
jgi:hypothetical protein